MSWVWTPAIVLLVMYGLCWVLLVVGLDDGDPIAFVLAIVGMLFFGYPAYEALVGVFA